MSYNFVADSIHTQKKLSSRLSSSEVQFSTEKAVLRFWVPPPPLGLVVTYDEAYWKARSGLPISVNSTFFAMCYGWGATSEYRLKIGVSLQRNQFDLNFPYVRRGRLLPAILLLRKLDERTIRYKNFSIRFCRFLFTIHAFDRRTDRRTDGHFAHG